MNNKLVIGVAVVGLVGYFLYKRYAKGSYKVGDKGSYKVGDKFPYPYTPDWKASSGGADNSTRLTNDKLRISVWVKNGVITNIREEV